MVSEKELVEAGKYLSKKTGKSLVEVFDVAHTDDMLERAVKKGWKPKNKRKWKNAKPT